jgi:Zn-dependent protease with chaperone function
VALELLETSARQRSEYLADRRAARLVGSAAMASALCWDLVGVQAATSAVARRGEDAYAALLARPDPTPAQVAARAAQAPVRGHRVDGTHPPDALRIRLIERHPVLPSVDFPGEELVAAAEAELAQLRARTRKEFHETLRFGPAY